MARVSRNWVERQTKHARRTINAAIKRRELRLYPPTPPARHPQLDTHELQRLGWLPDSFEESGMLDADKPPTMRDQLHTLALLVREVHTRLDTLESLLQLLCTHLQTPTARLPHEPDEPKK